MQEIPIKLNVIAVIIGLGILIGIYTSYFLIKNSVKQKSPNMFMGLLILVLSLIMFEGWLNYTGYIFQLLWLTNFSEPLNFIIAPLIYLFIVKQFENKRNNKDWLHFIPFIVWLGYCFFFFVMPDVWKYNDNLRVMQLEIPELVISSPYLGDPLGIRDYVNQATIIHIVIYNVILLKLFIIQLKKNGETFVRIKNKTLRSIRNSFYHFLIITLILVFVKSNFESDVGDYLIFLYISFMIFMTSYQIMDASDYYSQTSSFLEGPVIKYRKSSLVDEDKDIILNKIKALMQNDKYFTNSTVTVSSLSKEINESSHHVSQVINERLNQSFFEMIAAYRVEEAKTILRTEFGKKLTIEEVAERVGYNSKSAFNSAFKKFTSQTPSQFRNS